MKIIQNRFSNLILARGFVALTVWPFFLLYGIEWLVRLCIDRRTAYRHISFEQEAYRNDWNPDYLAERKRYGWIRFINTKGATNE